MTPESQQAAEKLDPMTAAVRVQDLLDRLPPFDLSWSPIIRDAWCKCAGQLMRWIEAAPQPRTPVSESHAALADKVQKWADGMILNVAYAADGSVVTKDDFLTIAAALRAHPAGGVSEDDRAYDAMRAFQGGTWKGRPKVFREEELEAMKRALRAAGIGAGVVEPIPMYLRCDACSMPHIDEGEWATRPHKTHQCQHCGNEWRPANVPTVGVFPLAAAPSHEKGQ